MKKVKRYPEFKPNVSPKQVFKKGAFGGTYFRPIKSSVTGKSYKSENVIKEYPKSWFTGINKKTHVISSKYDKNKNKYKVKCGSSLEDWEKNDWIDKQDPYGWFQWYCRFYTGRRCDDDKRQIERWNKYAGEKSGRYRRRLINMCVKENKKYNDYSVSPVIRQGLHHWGYELNKKDFDKQKKNMLN